MARFNVGEIAAHIGQHDGVCVGWVAGERVEILACGPWKDGEEVPLTNKTVSKQFAKVDYLIKSLKDGAVCVVEEYELRKLPPDDTEDPGLTRLKRVLEQDSKQVKVKPRVLS